MIALWVFTDGRRHCIERTIPSALEHLKGPISTRTIYDDSGDLEHRKWLHSTFGPYGFEILHHPNGRQGFGGAIRHCWKLIAASPWQLSRFVLHLEDDFTFNREVDLGAMASVLEARPHLVQLALRRQPWNEEESDAGGIVEQWPDAYTERRDGDHAWLEHRLFFTTNPSLYRRELCNRNWPLGARSEAAFTQQLLMDPAVKFGFWGARDSGEHVHHIGAERVGHGY